MGTLSSTTSLLYDNFLCNQEQYLLERKGREEESEKAIFFLAMSRDHLQWESSSIALTHYQKKKNDERGERKHSAEKTKKLFSLENFSVKSVYKMFFSEKLF